MPQKKRKDNETRRLMRQSEKVKLSARKALLKQRYGTTLEEYDQRFVEQDGVCAICHNTCATGRILCQDHNHDTGRCRGLLCNACNVALGQFRDDPLRLESALRYLKKWA